MQWRLWRNRPAQAKAEIAAAQVGRGPIAPCCADIARNAAPGAAANHAGAAIRFARRAVVFRRVQVVALIAIRHPFGDVAEHVVESPRVGLEAVLLGRADRRGVGEVVAAIGGAEVGRLFFKVASAMFSKLQPSAMRSPQ